MAKTSFAIGYTRILRIEGKAKLYFCKKNAGVGNTANLCTPGKCQGKCLLNLIYAESLSPMITSDLNATHLVISIHVVIIVLHQNHGF